MVLIGLEGPSGTGKTTILNALKEKGFHTIEEYVSYAKGHDNFPRYPCRNHKELEHSMDFFINLEIQRSHAVREGICFIDRSPLTFLAMEYGISGGQEFTDIRYVAERFQKAFTRGDIVIPDRIILLQADYTTIKERIADRIPGLSIYREEHYVKRLFHFYGRFLEEYCYGSLILTNQTSIQFNTNLHILSNLSGQGTTSYLSDFIKDQSNQR